MKPFNLEAALRGEAVVTRDGEKVTEIYQFKTDTSEYPVCAIFNGNAIWFDLNGKHENFSYELFMASEEKELCVICITFLPEWNSKYCSDCNNLSNRLLIFELAKRIKALEDKSK